MNIFRSILAAAAYILSLLVGLFGLYVSVSEFQTLYLKIASYHAIGGRSIREGASFLDTIWFALSHLANTVFVMGFVLLIASTMLWWLARKISNRRSP